MEGEWPRRLELCGIIAGMIDALPQQKHQHSWGKIRTKQPNQLPDGSDIVLALVTSDGGRVLACNDVICRLVGYTREELLDADVAGWHLDPQARDAVVTRVLEHGYVQETKAALTRRDGQKVTLELTVTVVSAQDGRALLVVGKPTTNREWPVETPDVQPKALG